MCPPGTEEVEQRTAGDEEKREAPDLGYREDLIGSSTEGMRAKPIERAVVKRSRITVGPVGSRCSRMSAAKIKR
jgi:hypothetical protein